MAATVIVLAGGGTGGHVYPALSIGDVLAGRGHRILYYGDPARLEGRVVEKRGYPLRAVRALAYPRGGLVGKVRFALALAVATWRASRQLRRDGAGLVLGVGGYISAPTVLGAWLAKREGLAVLRRLKRDLDQGIPPARGLIEGALVLCGGLLLVSPGVLTDLAGLVLLVPWTRGRLAPLVTRWLAAHFRIELGGGKAAAQRTETPSAPPFDHPSA